MPINITIIYTQAQYKSNDIWLMHIWPQKKKKELSQIVPPNIVKLPSYVKPRILNT